MNILIRADSSSNIGTGHIMRDLVLAKEFKNDNVVFATQNLSGNINHKIEEANYKIELLKSHDIDELDSLIKKLKIDLLVIDHYGIDYKYEKKLKTLNPNLKIFVLDDTYEKHFCDILLNHNIYADTKKYEKKVPKHCDLRCGAKYTLLRGEFKNLKKQNKKATKTKSIFLAMGGSDHKNLNIKILKVLKKNRQNIKINLATTTANKNLAELKSYCKDKKWINLHINSNKIAKLMNESSFAIITPSVTANEICFLDIPFIAIKTAENQKYMYKYLNKNGNMTIKKFDKKLLKKFISEIL